MSTAHKTAAMEIMKKHEGNTWGLECCRQIADAVCVPLSDIHTFQSDIFLAMEEPSHLTRRYEDVYLNDHGQVADVDT